MTLELLIQPLINADDQVTLEISLVRDSIGADRTVGELVVPDINTEQLSTSVTVTDGSAVILGGIITTTDRNTKTGVPFISRIPGLGKLFGRDVKSSNEAELIIMIQPRILKNQGSLDNFRDDYENSSRNTNSASAAFPQNSGMLPAAQDNPDAKEGELPVKKADPAPVDSGLQKKSKIRGKSGRPGGR